MSCEGVTGTLEKAGVSRMGLQGGVEGAYRTDAGLGDVAQELARLVGQASALKQQLESAVHSTQWTGKAASAFQQHAAQRRQQVAELLQALDSAHTAVGAAYAVAGIF
jgi:uncharacterized protein YukE